MVTYAPLDIPDTPRLAENITHFARALRRAGLAIGPGRVIDAITAVQAAGFTERTDFYWTLHACFVSKPEHRAIFHQVFRLYWRDPQFLEHMMSLLLPAVHGVQEDRTAKPAEKRAAEALLDGLGPEAPKPDDSAKETEIEADATLTMSPEERLKSLDFEQMSTAEVAEAKRMLARLTLPIKPLPSRRSRTSALGKTVDPRATLRQAMRTGGDIQKLIKRKPRTRYPNLVVLCDISGSMSHYSRLVLHFVHAVANEKGAGWAKVHAFTFGTRLTNITRHLQQRDVDAALMAAGSEAQDWNGGTRIGDCLDQFNKLWSRRVMGQGAVVLLITDGLDRGDPDTLGKVTERLHLSSKRLIWLNPLLRWDGFAPKAKGISRMLPHVDSFRAGHSITSLEDLAKALSDASDAGEKARMMTAVKNSAKT